MNEPSVAIDPFATKDKAYSVAHTLPQKKKIKKRRLRAYFITSGFYSDKIKFLKATRGYPDVHLVAEAALTAVRSKYPIGQELEGVLKSANRKRYRETETTKGFAIDPTLSININCIFQANKKRDVTRQGLLEEGLDILLGIDRSVS